MKRVMLIAAVAAAIPAHAEMYKCNEGGKTVYSDQPCAGAQKIDVRPASGTSRSVTPAPQAPSGEPVNASNNPQAVLAGMERERRRDYLTKEIRELEDAMEADRRRADAELAILKDKKRYANNNLAGATWEASISQEMQAVTRRYETKYMADADKLERLRKQRDSLAP